MKVNHKIFSGTYNKKMPSLLVVVYWVVKKRTLSGQEIKTWHYYDDYFADDDGVIEWHDEEYHQKRKAQKASIKKVLLPIAWHPSRYWDWCMSEHEKKGYRKNVVIKYGPSLYLIDRI